MINWKRMQRWYSSDLQPENYCLNGLYIFLIIIIIICQAHHHHHQFKSPHTSCDSCLREKKWQDPICKCQSIVKFLQKTLLVFVEVWSIIGTIFLPSPPAIGVSWLRGAKLSPAVKYYNNIWISFCKQNCILCVYF